MFKIDARFTKKGALGLQNCTRKLPKSRLGTPPRAKMHERNAQDQPRSAQERPRGNQDAPKSAQETPQRSRETVNLLKNRCCEGPERIPDAFGEHVAGLSSKKAFSEVSATKLRSVLSMIAKSVTLDFYRPCRGFRRFVENARCSIHACARREQNIEKGMSEASKICPGRSKTLQNRARSAAGHLKIDRNWQD